MEAGKLARARVLVEHMFDGIRVFPGSAIEGDADLIAQHAKQDHLDPHPDAVAYIQDQDGPLIDIAALKPKATPEADAKADESETK